MGLFSGVGHFLGNLFGGNDDDEKKKREAQQRAQQQAQNRPASVPAPQNQQTSTLAGRTNVLAPLQKPDNGVNLVLPGANGTTPAGFPTVLKKAQPKPVDPNAAKQAEIDRLTEQNKPAAKKQVQQGEGFFSRNFLNRGVDDNLAEQQARTRAINQYQEVHGYTKDPVVMANLQKNKQQGADLSVALQKSSDRLDKVAKVTDKAGEVAQYIPVTGSVLNLGLAGTEKLAKSTGNKGLEADTRNTRDKLDFGMTHDEFSKLDPEQQKKLQIVRNIGLGLSPLDFTGVGGIAKAEGTAALKKGAIQLVKEGVVDDATRTALKASGKAAAKNMAVSGVAGAGITLGGQQYLTGEMDPLEAAKNGLLTAGTSALFGGGETRGIASAAGVNPAEVPDPTVVAPGIRSINPNRTTNAVEQVQAKIPEPVGDIVDNSDLSRVVKANIPAIAQNEQFAPSIQAAYAKTGITDPYNLVVHALAGNNKKSEVRAVVEQMAGEGADRTVKNRLTKRLTEANTAQDVHDIIDEETSLAKDLPKPEPVPERVPETPAPDTMTTDELGLLKQLDAESKQRVLTEQEQSIRADLADKAQRINIANNPEPEPVAAAATPTTPAAAEVTPPAPAAAAAPQADPTAIPDFPDVPVEPRKPQVPATNATLTKATTKAPAKAKPAPRTAQSDLPAVTNTAAAATGEVGKSTGKYAKGQEYDKTSIEAARKRGSDAAANTSQEAFVKKVNEADGMTAADRDTAVALQARQPIGSPEHRALGDLINKHNTEAAQNLATIERVIRKTAGADKLTDRFVNKLYASTDDNIKLNEDDFASVVAKNEAFVKARDDQNAAVETFNTDPSKENADAVAKAFKAADEADQAAKFEEYKTASRVGKGSSNPKTAKLIKKLEGEAGVYTMDSVDASLLSSTRVMFNNFVNTLGVRTEESVFGKAGAALARQITGTTIGGGSRKGERLGAKLGQQNFNRSVKLRQGANGNLLVKSLKNVITSGNTIGDRNTYAAAYSGVYDHYRAKLKGEGYTKDELDRRSMVNSLADPDNIAADYMNSALTNNAMSSISTGSTGGKIENFVAEKIAAKTGNSAAAKTAAKAIVRVTLGFPTVIARSAAQGGRRALLGQVSVAQAVKNAVSGGPKEVTALHIKNAVKEAGSGAVMYGLGAELGAQGIITGSYPTDPDEQDRWKREGISENSIKIGGDYYSLPSALGVFSLPFSIGANAGRNMADGKPPTEDFFKSTASSLLDAMPTDSAQNTLDFFGDLKQGKDTSKYLAQTGSSLVRGITPAGALLNEVASMFDPNANDTTQGDAMTNFLNKVKTGIPGLSNSVPDKEVDGKPIKNPGVVPKLFGATSSEQGDGVKKSAELQADAANKVSELESNGVYTDKIRSLLDDDTKKIFDKSKSGDEVSAKDLKKLNEGITKGVSETQNTRALEDGDYDTNLALLKTKRSLAAADPTTRKETLENYDKQITRGEVYKELKTDYKTITQYQKTSLSEWRDLGDPESDTYNPELYQKLYDHDQALAAAGVSKDDDDGTKPAYFAKVKKAGSGRGGSRSAESDALQTIKSNTLGDAPTLAKIELGNLSPQKAQSVKIPTIQQIRSSDLIKKRKITVSKA